MKDNNISKRSFARLWRSRMIGKKSFCQRRRLKLIPLVLAVLSVYYMHLFKIPCLVAEKQEKAMKAFFWEGSDEGGGDYLVA